MRLLLDTHVAMWCVDDVERLGSAAVEAIRGASSVSVSVISPWELTIKAARGKFTADRPIEQLTVLLQRDLGATLLPVGLAHVLAVGELPLHHGDPFDRLLIAQARIEGLTIVTHDAWFSRYDVPVIQA